MERHVVAHFDAIATAFQERVQEVIWCSAATIDSRGRPRTRVLHPIWEGAVGWVTTRRSTPKIRHLTTNPHLSLGYIGDPFRPLYIECYARWSGDLAMREHVWALCRRLPEHQGGFDPAAVWGAIDDPENGLLQLTPWRIELNTFRGSPETLIWQAAESSPGSGAAVP